MTTVGLPDTFTYPAIELVSCLVVSSARAYGSEGWGSNPFGQHTFGRAPSGALSSTETRFPGITRRESCHELSQSAPNSAHPRRAHRAGNARRCASCTTRRRGRATLRSPRAGRLAGAWWCRRCAARRAAGYAARPRRRPPWSTSGQPARASSSAAGGPVVPQRDSDKPAAA
jgi:hypothetical protein